MINDILDVVRDVSTRYCCRRLGIANKTNASQPTSIKSPKTAPSLVSIIINTASRDPNLNATYAVRVL
jgi:hypothetical protein